MRLDRTTTGIRLTLGSTIREVAISSPSHIAITRQGSTWSIWVDGILADSFTSTYAVPIKPATLGPVDTVLDEIRLTKEALYTSTFVAPAVAHQAWYQGNPIFATGQIKHGLVSPTGQFGGSKGSIKQGDRADPIPGVWIAQLAGTQGSIAQGVVIVFGIYPGQRETTNGSVRQGVSPQFGEIWINGSIVQGDGPDPIPFVPPPVNIIASQRQFAEGQVTDGIVILFDGTRVVSSHSQFSKGSITFGTPEIRGQVLQGKLDGKQGSFQSTENLSLITGSQITGQGDVLPPYTGWDPSDIDRLMDALGISVTEDNLKRTQERLDEIISVSTEGQKRIQTLLAHKDGLWLDINRNLNPSVKVVTDQYSFERSVSWRNVNRINTLNKELRVLRKQLEIASGIPDRLKQIPLDLVD